MHINRYYCPDFSGEQLLYIDINFNFNKAPNIYKYLESNKALLINKSVEKKAGTRKWHLLFRQRNPELFDSPKIIIRQTGDKIIAAVDDKWGYFCIDSINVIKLKIEHVDKIHFFLGLLNSSLFRFIYQEISQEQGRVLAQVKPQRIKQMPVCLNDPELIKKISLKVRELIELKKIDVPTNDLEREIDHLIYELYKLTQEEINTFSES